MEPTPFQDMSPDATLCPGNTVLVKPGELYFVYCLCAGPATIDLPGSRPYKVDGIDTWGMTVSPLGTARPGRFAFTPPRLPYLYRLEPYRHDEAMRPEAKVQATPTEGTPPLSAEAIQRRQKE